MYIYDLAIALLLAAVAHRAWIVFYRLYLHPLAHFPGPRLAAASTLYRAFYQFWRDGELLHKLIELNKTYGPVIRISPNELEFCNPAAYFDIYSSSFNGKKDPDYYDHLRGEEDTFFFMDDDPTEYKIRFRPIAPLFSSKFSAQHELEIFTRLLSSTAKSGHPCSLAAGFQSLSNGFMNDFLFSNVPPSLRPLATAQFDDPMTLAMRDFFNWTMCFVRNFPGLFAIIDRLPSAVVSSVTGAFDVVTQANTIIASLVEHEKNSDTVKNEDCVMQRLIHHQPQHDSEGLPPFSDAILRSEALGLLLAGATDPANILAYGTFAISQDSRLQQRLYEELQSAWPDIHSPIPSHQDLKELPVLKGVVEESLRLTFGVSVGPARLVHKGGAKIDGHAIPAETVVAASSYFVHMNEAEFPDPEQFNPDRWATKHSNSLVAFSRGRRMCPAVNISYIILFASFATVFRKFHVEAYETTAKDFEWKQYFSNVFSGRPLRVILQERAC